MVVEITPSQSVRSKTFINRIPQRSQRFFLNFFKHPTFRSLHNVKYEDFDPMPHYNSIPLKCCFEQQKDRLPKGGEELTLVFQFKINIILIKP